MDVAIISPPGDTMGRQMGFNVLTRAHEQFEFPFLGIGTNLKSLKERPLEVSRVTKALVRANRFIRDDKEGAVRELVEWAKIEREHALASYDSAWKVSARTEIFRRKVYGWCWSKPSRAQADP